MEKRMTDLHCHILPGIDDGARDVETSLALLTEQKKQGVDNIIFTPHFNSERISVDDFYKKRAESLERLTTLDDFKKLDINYKLGSEVYYTVGLSGMSLDKLCFAGSDYILIELPTQARPHGLKRPFGNIVSNGYRPIIAHVERYSYMLSDPTVLYDLIDLGCLAHINAEALMQKSKHTSMVYYFVKHGLVHFMCSDCHSIKRRPPDLEAGFKEMDNSLGKKYSELFMENAETIFNGDFFDPDYVKKPRNLFGFWM